MSDDYASRQAQRDREYQAAFESPEARAWIESLPLDEPRRIEADGLLKPLVPSSGSGMRGEDLADSPLASETPDMAAAVDREPTPASQQTCEDERLWDVLRRLLGELLNETNAKLTIDCLAVVRGVGFLGDSMTEIAKCHGITRATVSKRCVALCLKLGLPPSRAMRALTARASYARTQHKIRRDYELRNNRRR